MNEQNQFIIVDQNMEEVLRAIYQKQTFKFKREKYKQTANKSYQPQIHKDNKPQVRYPTIATNKSSSTQNQTIDENPKNKSSRNSRRIYKSLQMQRSKTIELPQTKNTVHFPVLNKKSIHKKQTKKKPKFKSVAIAVYFITILNKRKKNNLLKRKYKSQKISSRLLEIIDKMINSYYIVYLEEQLTNYLSLLELKIENPTIDINRQILNNLFFTSKKLSQSTIRKDFLEFLLVVSRNHGFFPSDFLSEFEINRLQFSSVVGCLKDVNNQQTKMIVGICIGIKLFCSYILYRPWTLRINKIDFNKYYNLLGQSINKFGSIFYYLIMDEMQRIPPIICDPSQKEILKAFGIKSIEKINIYPNKQQITKDMKSTLNDLIPNQNRQFLNMMIKMDRQKVIAIKNNLIKWIDRITSVVIKTDKFTSLDKQKSPSKK